MGSRSKVELAYIAGFLDGDGSLMLQIKKRSDSPKVRFMSTICFYQDVRHEQGLLWIQNKLNIGYLSHRNDGMAELRINGFKQTKNILGELMPYIIFKQHQAQALYKAVCVLSDKTISNLNRLELAEIISCITIIQNNNYSTKYKKSKSELESILGLTP